VTGLDRLQNQQCRDAFRIVLEYLRDNLVEDWLGDCRDCGRNARYGQAHDPSCPIGAAIKLLEESK